VSRFSIGLMCCIAVAVVAAAIADPAVEFASNAGWFGRGNFTDHSNLDVIPALLVGLVLTGLYLILKIRAAFIEPSGPAPNLLRASDRVLSAKFFTLLPLAYGLQLLAVYAMETVEQRLVLGHILGGTIWLGGPVLIGLLAHALTCVLVSIAAAKLVRVLARATLHVLRIVRALATLAGRAAAVARRAWECPHNNRPALVRCRIGERAPPLLTA
jgi:hypothetical protein